MAVKIRLSRHGRRKRPFYHIIIADSRAPRDGRYIKKIGTYDPNTNPASIELDFDSALSWLQKGAQPTDTCRAILSYNGVMLKYHLLKGVKKGALTEQEVETKFQTWLKEKEAKIEAKREKIVRQKSEEEKNSLLPKQKLKKSKPKR